MTQPTPPASTPMTYRDAGVDIDAGNELVERIKRYRFAKEINSEAEAIRALIERGLEAEGLSIR